MSEPYTWIQLAECAEREVKQRERVYPRWVSDRKMTQAFAAEQIGMMRELGRRAREKAQADPQSDGRLF